MPRVMTDAEELAHKLGESFEGDCECWELLPRNPRQKAARMLLTVGGQDYRVTITKLGGDDEG